MSYEIFKQKLGYGARPILFEIEVSVPATVAKAVGKDAKTITEDLKFFVSGTQIPGRTIGAPVVNYEGEEVKLAGDPIYDDLTFTYLNDVEYYVREMIDVWDEYIVHNRTNKREVPSNYEKTWIVYTLNQAKERTKGYKLLYGYPQVVTPIDKNWDTKDTVETSTFTLRYGKYVRLDAAGNELILE